MSMATVAGAFDGVRMGTFTAPGPTTVEGLESPKFAASGPGGPSAGFRHRTGGFQQRIAEYFQGGVDSASYNPSSAFAALPSLFVGDTQGGGRALTGSIQAVALLNQGVSPVT